MFPLAVEFFNKTIYVLLRALALLCDAFQLPLAAF